MAKKHTTLAGTFKTTTIVALVLLATVIIIIQSLIYNHFFQTQAALTRSDNIALQKEMIQREVIRVVGLIDEQRSHTVEQTREEVRNRTREAYSVANHIFQKHNNDKPLAEIQEMIVDALRPIRYGTEDLGYYFMTRLDGLEILFADRPQFEGTNMLDLQDSRGRFIIREMIDIARNAGEGFYEYPWSRPNSRGKNHQKISYLKYFPPLDCFIGTGLYYEDIEHQITNKLLSAIAKIRFGNDGYIFINTLDGNALVSSGKRLSGENKLWEEFNEDPEKMRAIFDQEYRAALKPEGDFIYYSFNKPSAPDLNFPKASFIYGLPELNWLVGAGVYLDEVEKNITLLEKGIFKNRITSIISSIILTIGISGLLILLFNFLSRNINRDLKSIVAAFDKVAREDQKISREEIHYTELAQIAESANAVLRDKISVMETLKRNEARFRELTELLPEAVYEADSHLLITYANQRAHELFGYDENDIKAGLQIKSLIVPEDLPRAAKSIRQIMAGEAHGRSEYNCLRKDGSSFPALFHSVVMRSDDQMIGMCGIIVDLTERKKAEDEILRLRKLESIGVLAGGIAHDFNNLLAGLFGNIEMAKRHLNSESGAYRYIVSACKAMERATSLTKQLLTFAKGGDPIREALSLAELIDETARFCLRGSNVRLQLQIAPDLWMVDADKGQLSQVISNLVINAKQAMPEGGKISINAENFSQKNTNWVRLLVQDQGEGIEPELLDKIFDPYFTTKTEGSGLGLATCYSIISKHKGQIMVDSVPGLGTTFTMLLPTVTAEIPPSTPPELAGNASQQKLKILILDDEEMIRQMLGSMLEEMGHSVTHAERGHEAIQFYADALNDARYDIVITDLTLPGDIGGLETAKAIQALDKESRIIVSSGYANDPIMSHYAEYGFIARVVKPYSFAELEQTLRKCLD